MGDSFNQDDFSPLPNNNQNSQNPNLNVFESLNKLLADVELENETTPRAGVVAIGEEHKKPLLVCEDEWDLLVCEDEWDVLSPQIVCFPSQLNDSGTHDGRVIWNFEKRMEEREMKEKDNRKAPVSTSRVKSVESGESSKGNKWTYDEHRLLLLGLKRYNIGKWKLISKNFVTTRTPTQIASHAQKYFNRLKSAHTVRKRGSMHDITVVKPRHLVNLFRHGLVSESNLDSESLAFLTSKGLIKPQDCVDASMQNNELSRSLNITPYLNEGTPILELNPSVFNGNEPGLAYDLCPGNYNVQGDQSSNNFRANNYEPGFLRGEPSYVFNPNLEPQEAWNNTFWDQGYFATDLHEQQSNVYENDFLLVPITDTDVAPSYDSTTQLGPGIYQTNAPDPMQPSNSLQNYVYPDGTNQGYPY